MKKSFSLLALCAILFCMVSCQDEPGNSNYFKINGTKHQLTLAAYVSSADGTVNKGSLTNLSQEEALSTGVIGRPHVVVDFGNKNDEFWLAGYYCTSEVTEPTNVDVLGFTGILGDIFRYYGDGEKPWTYENGILTIDVKDLTVPYCHRVKPEDKDTTTTKISIHYSGPVHIK